MLLVSLFTPGTRRARQGCLPSPTNEIRATRVLPGGHCHLCLADWLVCHDDDAGGDDKPRNLSTHSSLSDRGQPIASVPLKSGRQDQLGSHWLEIYHAPDKCNGGRGSRRRENQVLLSARTPEPFQRAALFIGRRPTTWCDGWRIIPSYPTRGISSSERVHSNWANHAIHSEYST